MSSNRFKDKFTVHVISSASMDIFQENTLANFKNFFNDENNLTGDWKLKTHLMEFWLRSVSGDMRNHKTTQIDLTPFHDPIMEKN